MLNNKKIIIVGGSSGIGLKVSECLLAEGSKVIIGSRSRDKLLAAKKKLNNQVTTYELDASDEKSVVNFFANVGSFDHLVVTIKPDHLICDFNKSNITDAREAFNSKFWGQYNLVRHCLGGISKNGSITLTSGIAAKRSYKGFSSTAAINGAIESLVKSLSGEVSPIRINAVSPGFIERHTEDISRLDSVKGLGARPSVGRLGTPKEVALAYVYLLKNEYSTGSILTVDGGELCA